MGRRDRRGVLGTARELNEFLREQSVVEGLLNGRRAWLAIGAVVWGARGVRRGLRRQEKVVAREVLRPGQHIVVTEAIVRPTRRQRRRARRDG